MCTICGCAEGEMRIENEGSHDHQHAHHGHSHAPGMSHGRMVQIEQDILSKNNAYAEVNRHAFAERAMLVLNFVSSPGSGKTTLLTRTIQDLKDTYDMAVIEGDQQTTNDADRIRETGVNAIQVNTGKGCHLDAHMVGHAAERLGYTEGGVLFVENVGNLVCPAAFDLGEAHKVAILSVTEGEDKPLKYPDMFAAADVMLLNKSDLLPHLTFDVEKCAACARQINPRITIFEVSAQTGHGMDSWYRWLDATRQVVLASRPDVLKSA